MSEDKQRHFKNYSKAIVLKNNIQFVCYIVTYN